ncbi:MAG: carboxypeptidase-like regulatory domain-containing protein [Tannerella sp.]|jgi:hypothetical protein|nr:carboxypeptidase-like regulatory domain-containing protein [Tannerella sp.]
MRKSGIKFIIYLICLCGVTNTYAQHQISGRVIHEENANPLEFANITLSTADSVFVTGTTTDQKGHFLLKNIPSGDYLLIASYLGFTTQAISLNGLSKPIDIGDIFMTEENNQLETVTVTASNITNKADRLIIFVTDQQKANSSNGINLLTTMQLPRLTVNPIMNEVSLPGDESVAFCINGVIVNMPDIRAIQPYEVIRIEYLDNPGVRYGDADVVINYILKRKIAGGSVSMDLGNAVTTSFGDDQIAAKFNYKKSEFGLNYSIRYRNPTKVWGDEERTFNFSDGSSLQRFDKGSPGNLSENSHNININYNLLENDTYYFNATVRYSFTEDDKMRQSQRYIAQHPDDITFVHQGTDTRQHIPSIDLYYSHSLKNKQTILFNVVGTYIHSNLNQKYEETKDELSITDVISDVDGKKYSIIGEGIYEKTFENASRLTTGIKHTQAFANNDYTGTVNSLTKMDQADSYIYAEYSGKKDKFSYIAGIGLSRSWAKQEDEDDYTYYTFRPKLTVQYDFTRSMFLRLKGEVYNTSPSLSRISAVDQYMDTLQVMRGNPALKPNLNYHINLLYSWKKGIYGVNFQNSYMYSPKPIMETTYRENNLFIHSFENHRNWQKLNSELTLSAGPIKKILMLSLTGGVNHYISNGNSYSHTYTNFYYRLQLMGMYKKFSGIFQSYSAYDSFSGESLNGGEKIHLFMLSYNAGKFTVGAGIMLPFSDQYKRYAENRNIYASSKMNMYANDFSRMILLKFAWNFNYGRKAKSGSKRLNNTDTDTGIMRTN